MSIIYDIRPKFYVGTYQKLEFFLLKSELFRDKMKTPIAVMLGLLLTNVACLPKDVATAIQNNVATAMQKTETEELSRERRSASSFLNTFKVILSVKNIWNILSFYFSRAVGGVRKRQSGSSNTAADCNFSKGIKVFKIFC